MKYIGKILRFEYPDFTMRFHKFTFIIMKIMISINDSSFCYFYSLLPLLFLYNIIFSRLVCLISDFTIENIKMNYF